MTVTNVVGRVVLVVALSGVSAWGQGGATGVKPGPDAMETFYLKNVSQTGDGNEIVTAVRNLLRPESKVYYVASQNAVTVGGSPEQVEAAGKLLRELDRPKKTYRLTYTMTELDGGRRVGTQHFSVNAVAGQRVTLKEGSKVPVATGSYTSTGSTATQTQMTYLDVGMNFDSTLYDMGEGAMLKSKVEQSGIAAEKSGVGDQDPVVRQTVLEGVSYLTLGKPAILGSIDVPGSMRHMDIEVMLETDKGR